MIQEGKCIHFNGTVNKTCEAGVRYGDVAIERPFGGLPCFQKNNLSGLCKAFQLPTSEESQATMAIYGIDPAARESPADSGHGSRNRQQPQGKNQ